MPAACRSIGIPGVCAGFCLGSGTVLFLFAVMNTTIANVSFLMAATPMAAALLGWWLLKERVRRATWISIIIAMLGVLVMVYEGIAEGGWFGNSMAILAAAFLGGVRYFSTIWRADRSDAGCHVRRVCILFCSGVFCRRLSNFGA